MSKLVVTLARDSELFDAGMTNITGRVFDFDIHQGLQLTALPPLTNII